MRNWTRARNGMAVVLGVAVAAWIVGAVRGQVTVPPPDVGKPLTMKSARWAVQLLALESPNPHVREMASHEHDADWTMDIKAETFAVKIHGLQDKVFTGKFQPIDQAVVKGPGTLSRLILPAGHLAVAAVFDDAAGLSRDWVVPADAELKVEEAKRCLAAIGESWDDPHPLDLSTTDATKWYSPNLLKTLVTATKGVETKVDAATGQITGTASASNWRIDWRLNLTERTFVIRGQLPMGNEGAQEAEFTGRFGWDKDRHWTAWPVDMTAGRAGRTSGNLGMQAAVPEQNLARDKAAVGSSVLEGHAAEMAVDGSLSTYWQPAADDGHPTWSVDLKATMAITTIRLSFTRDSGYREPTIQVSDDQRKWRTVSDSGQRKGGGMGTAVIHATSMPADTTARFVQLSFPSSPPVVSSVTPRAATDRAGSRAAGSRAGNSRGETIQLSEVVIDGTPVPK